MKKLLLMPALLAAAATTALAQSSLYAQEDLRAECAKSQTEYGGNYAGAAAYPKDYSKDAKGYYVYGDRAYKPCTETQYAAYLDRADPTEVMAAYPAGAGRPTVKRDAKREPPARDERRPASPR